MVATLCSQAIHQCPTGFDRDVQRAARWILQHDNQQKGIVTPTADCHFDRTPSPGRRIVTDGFTHRDRDGITLQRNTTHHESRSRRKPLLAYNGLRNDLDDLSGQCAPTAPTRMDAIAHVTLETGFECVTFTRIRYSIGGILPDCPLLASMFILRRPFSRVRFGPPSAPCGCLTQTYFVRASSRAPITASYVAWRLKRFGRDRHCSGRSRNIRAVIVASLGPVASAVRA